MKCPMCGLLNLSHASTCDCGFDFDTHSGGLPVSFWKRYRFIAIIIGPILALLSAVWLISLLHE